MKEIQLSRGLVTQVDDADFEWLSRWKWHARRSGKIFYAARNGPWWWRNRTIFMHREILKVPRYLETDHVNRNSLDNQRFNLRLATRTQNIWNSGARKTHAPKGVDIHKGKWRARLRGKHLGYFKTCEEACKAFAVAARKTYGEFAPA
jgi:hypothetical protein